MQWWSKHSDTLVTPSFLRRSSVFMLSTMALSFRWRSWRSKTFADWLQEYACWWELVKFSKLTPSNRTTDLDGLITPNIRTQRIIKITKPILSIKVRTINNNICYQMNINGPLWDNVGRCTRDCWSAYQQSHFIEFEDKIPWIFLLIFFAHIIKTELKYWSLLNCLFEMGVCLFSWEYFFIGVGRLVWVINLKGL